MLERGKIKNRNISNQVKDYSGLQFGKITPTDIDGFIDFNNKLFIVIELKYNNTPVLFGQKLALERLVDNISNNKKIAVAIIASHNTNSENDIKAATAVVIEYRINKEWKKPRKYITLRQAIERLRQIYLH